MILADSPAHSVSEKKSRINIYDLRQSFSSYCVAGPLAVGSQNECTAGGPKIMIFQSTLALDSSSSSASIIGFGVTGSARPWSARTRPLMLQAVPGTTGLGLV